MEKPIIGGAYNELQDLVKDYAKADEPVLFIGETGTGKELFMQFYMKENPRIGPKMTINCAAVQGNMLLSEVFGHVKGAYTDAIEDRSGKIEACKDGILALDEIGDASLDFQAAILRVSEGNSYSLLGKDEEKKNPTTLIIAATNKLKNLRHDLQQRFHIIPIPPLQKGDIPELASHFLEGSLTEEVIKELQSREYPGNIRELEKTCKRLKVERKGEIFSKEEVIIPPYNFDYNRFRRETNTWNRFIQPVVDYHGKEHKFDRYKYKYQYINKDPLKWIKYNETHKNHKTFQRIYDLKKIYLFLKSIHNFINIPDELPTIPVGNLQFDDGKRRFEKGEIIYSIDIVKTFESDLRKFIEDSLLPYLLGYIYLKAELPTNKLKTTIPPHLSYLMDLPWTEAKKKFEDHYIYYNMKAHPDMAELISVTKLKEKTFKQKIYRKRKQKQKDKKLQPSVSSSK